MESKLDKIEEKVDKLDSRLDSIDMTLKSCSTCLESKPAFLFYKVSKNKDKYRSSCKKCLNKLSNEVEKNRRKIDEEYRQKLIKKHRNYKKTENYIVSTRVKSLLSKYGLSIQQYNELFFSQNGCCAICKTDQKNLQKRLFVDHCHDSGKVRGLLCSKCNHAIGLLNDNSSIIKNAMEYVRHHGK